MIKGQQYKLISDICLNINKNISKRKNEIEERLSNNLEDKLKKSGTKEKYIDRRRLSLCLKISIVMKVRSYLYRKTKSILM